MYLLNLIGTEELAHFVEPIYRKILDKKGQIPPWITETIKALFAHHFNLADAAKALYIHKNTMAYRVKRLQMLTGLTFGNNFYHTVILKFLAIYIERLQKATRV